LVPAAFRAYQPFTIETLIFIQSPDGLECGF
jgi:hypothetical protein